ncbi:uncharacterized protein LOC109595031 [Aethina tumida]|uniref:uncharacterized protein LOC109595031 n=1 Tax=Aethina tumida TaxID=116153 RepID=UPI0021479238|nr:uncharacterized protein LOC109595031 [Aethina tumida]
MLPKLVLFFFITSLLLYFVKCAVVSDDTGNELNGRAIDAKGLLTSLASNFISPRYGVTAAGGSSQVVSLNLTNLFVLVLLKALIFAAGSLGAGTWKGGLARSNEGGETILSDEEILLFLGYLSGRPGENGCLQKISCKQPEQAKRYVAAGDMLIKAARMFTLDPDPSYDYVLQEVDNAAELGRNGGDCEQFVCESNHGN